MMPEINNDVALGHIPVLRQVLTIWRTFPAPPPWHALRLQLGGLSEVICLIYRPEAAGGTIIQHAGAHAILAYGRPLTGFSVDALTPGRADAVRESELALSGASPFTVEDNVKAAGSTRRIARLYLPLAEPRPAVACAVVRVG